MNRLELKSVHNSGRSSDLSVTPEKVKNKFTKSNFDKKSDKFVPSAYI